MKKSAIYLLSLVVLLSMVSFHTKEQVTARSILNNMYTSIDNVKYLKFTMKKKEFINGKILNGQQFVKYSRNPMKVYTKIAAPNAGVEVLYLHGQNKNLAFINPNAFPYMTLSLDPYGSIMRNNNHHTVHEVGFDYINGIIRYIDGHSGANFPKYFHYIGDTVFDNRKCYKILIDYLPFSYKKYTVKKGETLKDIGYNFFISDYMILMLNKEIDDYHDVKEGQVILIPNAYSRKTYLFIDQKTHLPIVQSMYNEKGLFSQYEFYNLEVNTEIPATEFTKNYKEYNF